MLAGAAAAAAVCGAKGLGAVRAGEEQLLKPPEGKPLFGLDDAHHRTLSGEHAGHEDGHALMAADALGILAEGVAGHFKDVVFVKHKSSEDGQSHAGGKVAETGTKKGISTAVLRIFPGVTGN